MTMTDEPRFERYREAYLMMAHEVRYRAPTKSDWRVGGQIEIRDWVGDVEREATAYADRLIAEDEREQFETGCPHYRHARAFAVLIEAARLLARGLPTEEHRQTVKRLLRMAAREMDNDIG